jgi:hypothetical protein
LSGDDEKREITGLAAAMDFFKVQSGTIITFDTEDETYSGDKNIFIKPAWKSPSKS